MRQASIRLLSVLLVLMGAMLRAGEAPEPGAAPAHLLLIAIEGPIGPATTDHVRRGIQTAGESGAQALILRLDTPGGLEAATRDIDQAIIASPVPVIAWVAPSGARAASAGTFILYASHVAAMAPGTHLGAATPVPIGGSPPSSPPQRPLPAPRSGKESQERTEDTQDSDSGKDEPAAPSDPAGALQRKILHDSAAYIRALAELRGRNAEWAERAVREGVSLTANEALAQGVIELIAPSQDALLAQLDGRRIALPEGETTLRTAGAAVTPLEPDWRNRLLALITNPSVAYLLLMVGLYGLLLEGYNPGAMVPGVVGVLCLLLAAYALQVLPVNYAGLALIAVGLLLILGEALSPSFGVLGIGGIVALVLGSVVLFDSDVPGFAVSRGLIAGVAAVSGGALLVVLTMLGRARRRPASTGVDELLGAAAVALEDFEQRGHVRVRGEVWQADTSAPVRAGQSLRVEAVEGLRLRVRP